MRRNPRKRVICLDVMPNDGPSRDIFPNTSSAILECGHKVSLGVENPQCKYRPAWMACQECGAAGEAREVGRRSYL